METFIKYPGGKSKEVPLVLKYKPDSFDRYFEPFVGGGSIYFSLNNELSFINDKSQDLIRLYELIKQQNCNFKKELFNLNELWKVIEKEDHIETIAKFNIDYDLYIKYKEQSLKRKLASFSKFENSGLVISNDDKKKALITAKKTAIYMIIRDIYNRKTNNITHIACFYFLREYCYSSMFRFTKEGKFNVPYGGRSYDKKYMDKKLRMMFSNEMKEYMKKTEIFNLDFEEFFNHFQFTNRDFVFLDPPYDSDFSTYDNNSFDKNEQIRLKKCLSNLKANWMLIIKKTDFIRELYSDFNIYEYDVKYMVSFKNRNKRDTEHLLITNYSLEGGV